MNRRIIALGVILIGWLFSFLFTGHPESSWPLAQVDDYFLNILIMMGLNVILAVSLNLVNGCAGQFSLGHAGFMAVGAYASVFVTVLQWKGGELAGFLASLIFAGILAAITGVLVGIPSLRLRGDYLAIVTLGFGEIIRVIINNTEFLGGARGIPGIPSYTNFGFVLTVAVLVVYVTSSLMNSSYGLGFIAVRDDEIAAESVGVDSTKYKVVAFTLAAFFAGVAGGLYAHFIGYISPSGFDFQKSIDVVVMVILGGMGSTLGASIAAISLTILNEVLREVEQYRMIVFSLLLILLMIVRPEGLMGGALRSFYRKK